MQLIDNKSVYRTVEFNSWAYRSRLIEAERFLIARYLDKAGKTLEAGTAGGKILFEMRKMGFDQLFGFDFVPEFIQQAKKRDVNGDICFEVGDAVRLRYLDASFDQVIYLQQMLCSIDDESARLNAIREAFRVLRSGGTALFSFLCFEARFRNPFYWPYLAYLVALRRIRRGNSSVQHTPWLKLGGKFNLGAILDRGPCVYWYKTNEVCELLTGVGFRIRAVGSTRQIEQGRMCDGPESLKAEPITGMLYVVCNKEPQNV